MTGLQPRLMGRLIVQVEPGGLRHYLDGQPVHCGTGLELLMADGSWLPGRYEATWRRPTSRWTDEDRTEHPHGYILATFHFDLRCKTDRRVYSDPGDPPGPVDYPEASIEIPGDAEFRWPQRNRCAW